MKTKNLLVILIICSWILSACQPAQIPPTAIAAAATIAPPAEPPAPTNTPVPAATNTPFVPKATFKIAVAVPLTGDEGAVGTDIFHAGELAAVQLSSPLALMGYAVELVSYDDKHDLDTAVTNAKELIKDSDILCGVGHYNSPITIQATEIYHKAGLAFISPSSTNADVTNRGYLEVNRVVGRDDAEGAAGAHFAQERGFKAIYVLYDSSRHGQKNADYFKREAKKLGLNVVGELSTDIPGNFESVIKRILDTNTDLVYFAGGSTEQVGNFINEARAANYKGAILGTDYSFNQDILNFAGPFAIDGGGLFYTTIGASLASMPNAKQFEQDFLTKFGTEPQFYTPYAYDATGICLKAIENASKAKGGGIPTRAEVASAIHALTDYQGIADTYNFTKNGDPTVSAYQVYQVTTIDPNKWDANPVVATYKVEPPGK